MQDSIGSLYKFNSRPHGLYYDDNNDSLYFTDTRSGEYGSFLYRIDLRQKFFDSFLKMLKKEIDTGYEKL